MGEEWRKKSWSWLELAHPVIWPTRLHLLVGGRRKKVPRIRLQQYFEKNCQNDFIVFTINLMGICWAWFKAHPVIQRSPLIKDTAKSRHCGIPDKMRRTSLTDSLYATSFNADNILYSGQKRPDKRVRIKWVPLYLKGGYFLYCQLDFRGTELKHMFDDFLRLLKHFYSLAFCVKATKKVLLGFRFVLHLSTDRPTTIMTVIIIFFFFVVVGSLCAPFASTSL